MDKIEIQTDKLRLAQIRHFSKANNGVEVPKERAYAFLYQIEDGYYINILNPFQEFPVYKRVPYSNTTPDGLSYGTKIALAFGEERTGPCYVMENIGMDNIFGEKKISLDQLKQYVFASDYFFLDRPKLIENEANGKSFVNRFIAFNKKYREDKKKEERFIAYLSACMEAESYSK